MLHETLYNCVGSRVVRSGCDLRNAEVAVHGGYYAFHEFACLVIAEYKRDTLLEDESRE